MNKKTTKILLFITIILIILGLNQIRINNYKKENNIPNKIKTITKKEFNKVLKQNDYTKLVYDMNNIYNEELESSCYRNSSGIFICYFEATNSEVLFKEMKKEVETSNEIEKLTYKKYQRIILDNENYYYIAVRIKNTIISSFIPVNAREKESINNILTQLNYYGYKKKINIYLLLSLLIILIVILIKYKSRGINNEKNTNIKKYNNKYLHNSHITNSNRLNKSKTRKIQRKK
jgi:hypothetical protein